MYAETTGNDTTSAVPQDSPGHSTFCPARSGDERAHIRGEALSPSLRPWIPGDAPAFEMKFLLDDARARDVESRIAARLSPDPHSDPKLRNAYHISTIYCDTPEFDVFHRVGSYRRRKYRLRRYGNEPLVFLERKTKRGERVRKRRAKIDGCDLSSLSAFSTDPDWPGHWFHKQLVQRRLEPVCNVQYLRTAYVGIGDEGPLRLTFDRDVRTRLVKDWLLPPTVDGIPVLTGHVVCEFKFRGNLPALFKGIIQELALEPTGISKFRHCFRAAGGATNGSPGDV
jgi:hypothetical protein